MCQYYVTLLYALYDQGEYSPVWIAPINTEHFQKDEDRSQHSIIFDYFILMQKKKKESHGWPLFAVIKGRHIVYELKSPMID